MATINQNFFAELLSPKAAKWSAGVAFDRSNGLPLDQWSVFEDKTSAEAYLSNSKAYPGQVIAYAEDNGEMTVCVLSQNAEGTTLTLKPVGTIPVGDEKSIEVAEDGTISLKGVTALVFERDIMGEDGEPTGEKEEVQYQILMTKNGLTWVEPSKTTVEGLATLIDGLTQRVKALEDDRVTEQELADAIKDFATDDEVAAAVKVVADKLGIPSDNTKTAYELIVAEADRAAQAEEALGARIGAAKDGETAATGVYAYIDGVVNALVNGVDPDKIDSLNELIAWVEAHPDIVSGLDERLAVVEDILDGFGGEEEPETVKGYIDAHIEAAEGKYATQDALAGVKETADAAQTATQVQTAISTALEDYYTANEVDGKGYAVATDVEKDYAKKGTTLAEYGITDAYTATETDNAIRAKIQEMTGGESAADVLGLLNDYKASNDREVWGDEFVTNHTVEGTYTPDYSGESRVDKHANRILAIENKVGHDVEGEDKPATGLFAEIDAVSVRAEKGITDAAAAAQAVTQLTSGQVATNKTNIENLGALVGAIGDGKDNTLAGKIGALEAYNQSHTVEFNTLSGTVGQNTTDIGVINGEISSLKTKNNELVSGFNLINEQAQNNAADIAHINEVLINTGLELNNEVWPAILAIYNPSDTTGLLIDEQLRAQEEERKLNLAITNEIARAKAAEEAIYKAGEGEAAATGILAEEIARAKAAEEANKALIDGLDATLKAALENDGEGLDSIKELAVWIEEHETEVLPVIEQQGKDIVTLTTTVNTTLPAAIAAAQAAAEAAAKKYTDDTMVKADGDTIKNTNGTFSVQKVTTDMLVNGEEELILYGGNAGKKTEVTE